MFSSSIRVMSIGHVPAFQMRTQVMIHSQFTLLLLGGRSGNRQADYNMVWEDWCLMLLLLGVLVRRSIGCKVGATQMSVFCVGHTEVYIINDGVGKVRLSQYRPIKQRAGQVSAIEIAIA